MPKLFLPDGKGTALPVQIMRWNRVKVSESPSWRIKGRSEREHAVSHQLHDEGKWVPRREEKQAKRTPLLGEVEESINE